MWCLKPIWFSADVVITHGCISQMDWSISTNQIILESWEPIDLHGIVCLIVLRPPNHIVMQNAQGGQRQAWYGHQETIFYFIFLNWLFKCNVIYTSICETKTNLRFLPISQWVFIFGFHLRTCICIYVRYYLSYIADYPGTREVLKKRPHWKRWLGPKTILSLEKRW